MFSLRLLCVSLVDTCKIFPISKTKFHLRCFSTEGAEGEEEQNAEGRKDDEASRGVDAGGQGHLLRSTR